MSLRHGLLGLLNYDRMTGYELDRAFKDSFSFFWQAQTSQVYRELKAMEKMGWLTSEVEVQTGKPNKILYSITDSGKRELIDWLATDNVDDALSIRSEFLMKLFFSGERSALENIAVLKEFKTACIRELDALSKTDASIAEYGSGLGRNNSMKTVYWGLTARFGKSYMKMCLEFADEAINALGDSYVRTRS